MKIFYVLSAIFLSLPAFAASDYSTSLGVTLGSPYGVTGRTWLREENSIDYGFGWDLLDSSKFEVYSDYLWNQKNRFEINSNSFDLFYGAGLELRSHTGPNNNSVDFGPRLPVGVSYYVTHPDVELFAVFAFNIGIIPHSDVFIDLALGARFMIF
jgi:hypothetical protein